MHWAFCQTRSKEFEWITDAKCGSNALNLPVKKRTRQRLLKEKDVNPDGKLWSVNVFA